MTFCSDWFCIFRLGLEFSQTIRPLKIRILIEGTSSYVYFWEWDLHLTCVFVWPIFEPTESTLNILVDSAENISRIVSCPKEMILSLSSCVLGAHVRAHCTVQNLGCSTMSSRSGFVNPYKVFLGQIYANLPRQELLKAFDELGVEHPNSGLYMVT